MGNYEEQITGGSDSTQHRIHGLGSPLAESDVPHRGIEDERFVVIPINASSPLPAELRAAWQARLECQHQRGGSGSPFLGPSFASTVASTRSDVRLIVGYENDVPSSFLPIHVSGRERARPLGGRFCDLHGPVGVTDPAVFQRMLKEVGIRSWSFRRCPELNALPASSIFTETVSHVVRTDLGIEGLRSGGLLASTSQLKQALRKERKLAREVGPLRFEFDHKDPAVLNSVLRWKGDQRRRSGSANILEANWASETLRALHGASGAGGSPDAQEDAATVDGRGRMSVLWAGDQVVAAHFGLAGPQIMHWWIPTYSPEFAPYSPGLSLLLHLIRACHERGIERLELGHGDERYKSGFATGELRLASGAVDRSRVRLALGATGFRVRDALRRSKFEPGWVAIKRVLRRTRSVGTQK